jgi:PAS domain S-box-containing protein
MLGSPTLRQPPATLLLTLRGSVLRADPSWGTLTGRSVRELEGMHIGAVVLEEDHDALRAAIDRLLVEGEPQVLSVHIRNAVGRTVPLDVELMLIGDPDGATTFLLSVRSGVRVTPGTVHQAWRRGHMTLFAQPIFDAGTLRVIRHELLVRMLVPGGTVPAADFLPVIERLGLGIDVDCWVAGRAVTMLGAPGREAMVLEANVTAASIRHPTHFLRTLAVALDASGISGRRLMVALPAEAVAVHPEAARRLLAGLTALGVASALDHVDGSIDDLRAIAALPFDTIKLSRPLTSHALHHDDGLAALIRVVEAAHDAEAETVASSVDDEDTVALVRQYGVDAVQGYRFGAPVRATRA